MKAISGTPQSIRTLFSSFEFEIPEFQRPYSWGKDECDQLWDDLKEFFDSEEEKYFLGSIVVYPKKDNKKEDDKDILYVIDGQQRLTTLLILLKLFFESARENTILEKMIFKTDPTTGDVDKVKEKEPRIESRVFTCDDKKNLKLILEGNSNLINDKDNKFKSNYDLLHKRLKDWWEGDDTDACKKIISKLQHGVVMLRIHCETKDDALTLFQIINDRGKPLNDADIFKAEIYKAVPEKARQDFISRWDKIAQHEDLFRIYMHISRAEKGYISKEIGLRKYMLDQHFKSQDKLSQEYQGIMDALESINWRERGNNSYSENPEDPDISSYENIYWGILKAYPNAYWKYPLHVFLHKHINMEWDDGDKVFSLEPGKGDEYIKLMEETLRFCLVKGVLYNAVNTIKDTIFRVCAAIYKGEDYVAEYRKNIDDREIENFYQKLEKSEIGKRYRTCLILLSSLLNPEQEPTDYSDFLQHRKTHIEHILPKQWNHFDGFDQESHGKYIDNIGNLMPLERRINIKAKNEFFSRKKNEYKNSAVQDAVDLSKHHGKSWSPRDIDARKEELVKRLKEFLK